MTETTKQNDDDYLWDKSGTPDPDVQRLEQVLAPFAHDGRGFRGADHRSGGVLRRGRWVFLAAAALIAAFVVWYPFQPTDQLELIVKSNNTRLRGGDTFEPKQDEELILQDPNSERSFLSEITLEKDSSLEVGELRKDRARLHLARGTMHAFVSGEVPERFFQVGTRATDCVDLGCQYTLEVDGNDNAHVHVTMGRVAFEDPDDSTRAVHVPAGATCVATKRDGAGTPRHIDTPQAVKDLLDRYDANRGSAKAAVRLKLVQQVLKSIAVTGASKYTLIAWHFLQDPATQVSTAAMQWLMANHGANQPSGFTMRAGRAVSHEDREAWRLKLEGDWGW